MFPQPAPFATVFLRRNWITIKSNDFRAETEFDDVITIGLCARNDPLESPVRFVVSLVRVAEGSGW